MNQQVASQNVSIPERNNQDIKQYVTPEITIMEYMANQIDEIDEYYSHFHEQSHPIAKDIILEDFDTELHRLANVIDALEKADFLTKRDKLKLFTKMVVLRSDFIKFFH